MVEAVLIIFAFVSCLVLVGDILPRARELALHEREACQDDRAWRSTLLSLRAELARAANVWRWQLGRVLINRQPNADLDAPPNFRYWG